MDFDPFENFGFGDTGDYGGEMRLFDDNGVHGQQQDAFMALDGFDPEFAFDRAEVSFDHPPVLAAPEQGAVVHASVASEPVPRGLLAIPRQAQGMARPMGLLPVHRRGMTERTAMGRADEFDTMCKDPNVRFNPRRLGFVPRDHWDDRDYTFGQLVSEFFQRKSSSRTRFVYKLYNALKITEYNPRYSAFIGVELASDSVIRVDKKAFARLTGIRAIDGSLFHNQGNFPSHGFFELTPYTVGVVPSDGVDWDDIRLLTHKSGLFTRMSDESSFGACKWVKGNKR